MKFLKSLICVLIISSFFSCLYSFSAFSNNLSESDFNQIYESAINLLNYIKPEKNLYGLENVNFDNLTLGENIPSYIKTNNGFSMSNILYFPILEDEKWVATLSCCRIPTGWYCQISNSFVENLPSISSNDNIKLLFDDHIAYLSKNSQNYKISSYGNEELLQDCLTTDISNSLQTKKLSAKRPLNLSCISSKDSLNRSSQKNLPIPLVDQCTDMSCSLACLESIGRYFGADYSYTQSELCSLYPVSGEVTLNTGATLEQLQHICAAMGKNDAPGLSSDYKTRANFSFSLLKNYINSNKPIIASCQSNDSYNNYGHAVAIRGYTTFDNSSTAVGAFAFMDPWEPATYRAGTVTNNNSYDVCFIRDGDSVSFSAHEFLAVGN